MKQSLSEFECVLLQVFTELYKKLHYFNFSVDLLNYILKFSLSKKNDISTIICGFYNTIWQDPNPALCKLNRPSKAHSTREARQVPHKA